MSPAPPRGRTIEHHGRPSATVESTSFGTPPAAYLPWGYFIDASSKPIVGNCGHAGEGSGGRARVAARATLLVAALLVAPVVMMVVMAA